MTNRLTKGEAEHYYYVIFASNRWQIVKANNQRQMRQAGYDTKTIAARYRHYDEASRHLHAIHHPERVYYISLTGNNFID